ALAFGDVDGLKSINDTYGHAAGDQALQRVALVLRNSFRRSDVIARIGGDEFTILAIDVVPERTNDLFRRFEKALADENVRCASGFSVTLSLGVVQIDHAQRLSVQEWLKKADQALYQKRNSF
ncbi:MAG: GGDEF domain-containing protein, partial [Candidatus Omnitrophica bacterium]|nr:GGDEF domain-containing protein [Candidatus Omnitrophota bacterium]